MSYVSRIIILYAFIAGMSCGDFIVPEQSQNSNESNSWRNEDRNRAKESCRVSVFNSVLSENPMTFSTCSCMSDRISNYYSLSEFDTAPDNIMSRFALTSEMAVCSQLAYQQILNSTQRADRYWQRESYETPYYTYENTDSSQDSDEEGRLESSDYYTD